MAPPPGAIDAFVVAAADLAAGAVIATVDSGDITRLAEHATRVRGADITGSRGSTG